MRKTTMIVAGVFLISFCLLCLGCQQVQQVGQAGETTHPNVPIARQINFVGDSTTMIYHYPSCKFCPHESTAVPIDSPLSAIRAGFKPCKKCKPPAE